MLRRYHVAVVKIAYYAALAIGVYAVLMSYVTILCLLLLRSPIVTTLSFMAALAARLLSNLICKIFGKG